MNDWIEIAEIAGNGLVFSWCMRELGVSRSMLDAALRGKELYPVRRGVYARPPASTPEGLMQRHQNQVRALVAVAPNHVVSHLSAAAMYGLPIIGQWPDRAQVLALGSHGGTSKSGFIAHRTEVEPSTRVIDGVVVTSLERTLVDVATTSTLLVTTAVLDSALHQALTTKELLGAELDSVSPRYGYHRAETAVEFADDRSASAGESLSRVRMHQLRFEAPELQIHVSTFRGEYDADFGWEGAKRFGEFDGFAKYARVEYLKGEAPAQAVVREKAREDAIRAKTGRTFVRWGWNDALSPRLFDRLLREGGVPYRRGSR